MPPRKGQRQARGLARRTQILDAALLLVAEGGYRGTSLATVASAVGLTEAGVLHHFPSKDVLVREVLAHRDTLNPEAELHVAEAGGGLESLARFPYLADILLENPVLMRFDAVVEGESIAEGSVVRDHVRERLSRIRSALADMLREGVRRGEVRDDLDLDAIAIEVVAFMNGVQTQWLLDPEGVDLRATYAGYVAALMDRLRSPARRL